MAGCVRGMTPLLCWKKTASFCERFSCPTLCEFYVCDVLCVHVLGIYTYIYIVFSAMCFASGSIFGNKFLTPVGIKTLFPIFENSLFGKELAERTPNTKHVFQQRTLICPKHLFVFLFPQLEKQRTRFNLCCMATLWLKGEVGGKPPFVSSKRLQIPSLLFPDPFATKILSHTLSPMAGCVRGMTPLLCWKKTASFCERFSCPTLCEFYVCDVLCVHVLGIYTFIYIYSV